jgi:hypothetical protein
MHREELDRMGILQEVQDHRGEGFCAVLLGLMLLYELENAPTDAPGK